LPPCCWPFCTGLLLVSAILLLLLVSPHLRAKRAEAFTE
jgi:hypothetical protein